MSKQDAISRIKLQPYYLPDSNNKKELRGQLALIDFIENRRSIYE